MKWIKLKSDYKSQPKTKEGNLVLVCKTKPKLIQKFPKMQTLFQVGFSISKRLKPYF